MSKKRGGTGRYVETTTLDAVLGVFETVDGPVVTSADVSDALGCSRDTARRKLAELHREGRVERRETAARVVWWLADDVDHDRDRDYLKSFGKYADTNIAETAEAVGERFDRDLRDRRDHRTDADR